MEEKEIKRPNGLFRIFLFIFFYLLVMWGISMVRYLSAIGFNVGFQEFDLVMTITYSLQMVIYFLSFIAIYKALQGKPYSIAMLRFAIVFFILMTYSEISDSMGTYTMSAQLFTGIPKMFFYIIFLVYLKRSKKLQVFLPKNERHFGLQGWGYLLVFILFFCSAAYPQIVDLKMIASSRSISLAELELAHGERSTGISYFIEPSSLKLDSCITIENDLTLYRYYSSDTTICLHIQPILYKENMRCMLNSIITQSASLPDTIQMKEVFQCDTTYNGIHRVTQSYKPIGNNADDELTWTISILKDLDSYKIVIVSLVERNDSVDGKRILNDVCSSTRFDIQNKAIRKEESTLNK